MGYNEKYPIQYLVDYLRVALTMQKSDMDYLIESHAEQEWKDSGVKSWKELFNLD